MKSESDCRIHVSLKVKGNFGDIVLYNIDKRKWIRIGNIVFMVYDEQITATDVDVIENYQKLGFGKLMIEVLQRYAQEHMLSVYLYSLRDAIEFYKKCGFQRVSRFRRRGCKLILTNVEKGKDGKQVSYGDMVWVPKGLKCARVAV